MSDKEQLWTDFLRTAAISIAWLRDGKPDEALRSLKEASVLLASWERAIALRVGP